MPMIGDMMRAIGVMAVLVEDDLVLSGNGCPVGTDLWSTVAIDYAGGEGGSATKVDAVRAELGDLDRGVSNGSILRAIARSEREGDGLDPIIVETSEGLPTVISLERVNDGWRVADSSWCRRRAG
jgi:hypothetical protein